ncbi:MAG: BMP family ABC transporter substrate-binding protein [Mogibacterium sp.]|nr:BMP family ABC transporter substrate-binding protein [Mogibacterium sp.]
MKKKLIALLTCLVMVMMPVLASCGGGGSSDGGGSDEMKVGLICLHDENSTYDLNFINGFEEAMEKAGIDADHYLIKKNIPEGQECYDAAGELVDAGCTLIFSDSFGHQDFMMQAAQENPEVQFVSCTGTNAASSGLDNFHNAFASIYEGRYLAGVAAGMKLNELKEAGKLKGDAPKMGYVGAFTYAEVISGYTSFYLGAKSVCPDVTMDVTFTGSWYDETAEKEGATKLIQGGCDLISQHADSMGAPTACENAGVPDVSYNGSTVDACPNTFIVSSRIDWAPFFASAVDSVKNGSFEGPDFTGTLDDGSVVLTEINDKVAAEGTADKLAEVEAGLKDGSIHVFDTALWTVDGKTLTEYTVPEATYGDFDAANATAILDGGYFHESEFRSAPYFDINIDGIKLLDTKF